MMCADCKRQITYREFSASEGRDKRDVITLRACSCKEHGNARRCTECCKPKKTK